MRHEPPATSHPMPHHAALLAHRRRGMTLVEMLLAVALFSLLMTAVGYLSMTGLRVQQAWAGVAPYMQLERALHRLDVDLESAQPLFRAPVIGEAQRLELARVDRVVGSDGKPRRAWVKVVYRVDTSEEGAALMREVFLVGDGEAGAEPLQEETVLALEDGAFAFGVLEGEEQTLAWVESWDGEADGVPRLVQLTVTLPRQPGLAGLTLSRVMRNPAGTLPLQEAF